MAKKSAIARNEKRKKMVKKHSSKMATNKKIMKDPNSSPEEKMEAMFRMQKVPNNAYKIRIRNRCALTGRPRGNDNFKKFNICRVKFRDLASIGLIPGVTKSSW